MLEQGTLADLVELMARHPLVLVRSFDYFLENEATGRKEKGLISAELANWRPQRAVLEGKLALGARTIGLHIRRQDQIRCIYYTPLILYVRLIAQELRRDPSARFFVCTDDPSVVDALRERFGAEKLLAYAHAQNNRNFRAGMRAAFLDLLTLADCARIYGSKYSSFPQVAALVGGKPCFLLARRGAPDDWHRAGARFDVWVEWKADRGWLPRPQAGRVRGGIARLAGALVWWQQGDFYQLGFWQWFHVRPYFQPAARPEEP